MVRSIFVTIPKNEHEPTLQVLSMSEHVHGLATFHVSFARCAPSPCAVINNVLRSCFHSNPHPAPVPAPAPAPAPAPNHRARTQGDGVALFIFKSDERKLQVILRRLNNIGVGTRFGTIDVQQLVTTLPSIRKSKWNSRRHYRVDDRMSVEEIKDAIDDQSRLTFDFLAMTTIAAVIAGSGLVGDSGTTVVASMLVSPLMGPLLCVTFGIASKNSDMIKRGLVNKLTGSAICFAVGCIIGLCTIPYYKDLSIPKDWNKFIDSSNAHLSSEMIERGSPSGLLMGFTIAIPSGIGVTLAVTTSGGINTLVGVAISAALVPPIVNAGICVSTGIFLSMIRGEGEIGENFVVLGTVSFVLFMINVITMVAVGILMMRVKKVTTIGAVSDKWDQDMYYSDGANNRSSFFRAGVEMRSKEELLKALSPSRKGVAAAAAADSSQHLLISPLLDPTEANRQQDGPPDPFITMAGVNDEFSNNDDDDDDDNDNNNNYDDDDDNDHGDNHYYDKDRMIASHHPRRSSSTLRRLRRSDDDEMVLGPQPSGEGFKLEASDFAESDNEDEEGQRSSFFDPLTLR